MRLSQIIKADWIIATGMRGVSNVPVHGVETRDEGPIANCGTQGAENARLIAQTPAMVRMLVRVLALLNDGDAEARDAELVEQDVRRLLIDAGFDASEIPQ